MSTYYYMACTDCEKRTAKVIAVVRLDGQHIDSADTLMKFLMKHHGHDLRFFSEYNDELLDYSKEFDE